jgi:hypothetical protein
MSGITTNNLEATHFRDSHKLGKLLALLAMALLPGSGETTGSKADLARREETAQSRETAGDARSLTKGRARRGSEESELRE